MGTITKKITKPQGGKVSEEQVKDAINNMVKTEPKKVEKPKVDKKDELDKTNSAVTTQKVIIHRDLKYIYPKGCNDTLKRKSFRQKVRNTLRSMELQINKLKGDEKKQKETELQEFLSINCSPKK